MAIHFSSLPVRRRMRQLYTLREFAAAKLKTVAFEKRLIDELLLQQQECVFPKVSLDSLFVVYQFHPGGNSGELNTDFSWRYLDIKCPYMCSDI